ncbi:hypothetical protein [Neisseria polysaccharea]
MLIFFFQYDLVWQEKASDGTGASRVCHLKPQRRHGRAAGQPI